MECIRNNELILKERQHGTLAQRRSRCAMLTYRAKAALDVEPVAAVLMTARVAMHAIDNLVVAGSGRGAGRGDDLLLICVCEARLSGERARSLTLSGTTSGPGRAGEFQ